MENKRQKVILEIIRDQEIKTQDELIKKLAERGMNCAQATISRDIKRLHLLKEPCGTGYRYVVSAQRDSIDAEQRLRKVLQEYGSSADYANNLVVFRTMPGLAMAAGAALDSMGIERMLGCVAGDDSVLIVMRDAHSAQEFCQQLSELCSERE